MYVPEYTGSWALIVGINSYRHVSPLGYARNDAEVVAKTIRERFRFPEENVFLLLDEAATRQAILESFLEFSGSRVSENDRIFVFFAGHGYTQRGRRGEVGYLVPVDGNPDNLASLIRWDDLTRNSDLIAAKHILFIMDACYGGLAVARSPGPGSMRFLKDMLQRYARQVITAGKADEVVADSGGPIPNHSVFTGHLLQALGGAAASPDGILSANTIMAYVYERVAKDPHSNQTPHFGFIDGDGDFIFDAPVLAELETEPEIDSDILIEVPPSVSFPPQAALDPINLLKECIPDPRCRIKLDDIVTKEVRRVQYEISAEKFPVQTAGVTAEDFLDRLRRYESVTKDLWSLVALLTHWGTAEHLPVLKKIIARMADYNERTGGKVAWLELRWYPTLLLLYTGGIAALYSGQYRNLSALFLTRVGSRYSGDKTEEILIPVVEAALEMERMNLWKILPGHERNYVPRSEYLFKALQPTLDDLFFLGRSYEHLFDRFEILFALVYADLDVSRGGRIWGPPGRFAWKHSSRRHESPFSEIVEEANVQGADWAPLKAGLFGGATERFKRVADGYAELIARLNWW